MMHAHAWLQVEAKERHADDIRKDVELASIEADKILADQVDLDLKIRILADQVDLYLKTRACTKAFKILLCTSQCCTDAAYSQQNTNM
eukprot:scaffold287626_cov19-Tisochrysis_lutea.AAC.1